MIKKEDKMPMLEIELELYDKEVSFVPAVGEGKKGKDGAPQAKAKTKAAGEAQAAHEAALAAERPRSSSIARGGAASNGRRHTDER